MKEPKIDGEAAFAVQNNEVWLRDDNLWCVFFISLSEAARREGSQGILYCMYRV